MTSGVKEIREVIEQAKLNRQAGRRTLLFVDEVHRFNKSQQDAFLPHIEDGTIIFIGATTENPSFELNNALLSRARIYILKPLQAVEILKILRMAIADTERGLGNETLVLEDDVLALLADYVNGDARFALNCLELMVDMAQDSAKGKVLNKSLLTEVLGERQARFDKGGDRYYDLISALHKSIRGSSADGALYWYARILTAGGDPLYVARRLLAIASEDIGNADPRAMQIAIVAWIALPEWGLMKVKERLPKRSFIWQLPQRAMRSIKLLMKQSASLKRQKTTMCRRICVMLPLN
ncbi:Replication-associated recombination protein A [Mannheimia haemolytica]|uniref:Replication-associated recombination protein A n=1 Tax=Mannheimia haemolytica TaxID=75985 RepID=A0A378N5H8_MANHA|nr:Replication-associated recombination protein A [Mannheimia haemolytica]